MSATKQYDDFICNTPGQKSNAQSTIGLQIGHYVSINGSTKIEDFIQGEDDASVYSIQLSIKSGGFYNYRLTVNGKGPKGGIFSTLSLYFTDATGNTYSLNLTSSTRKDHVVDFDSVDSRITNIAWN
jgi:hypothetical protein